MSLTKNRIICAIDTTDKEKAAKLASDLYGHVCAIKIGLEFFTAHGIDGIIQLADMVPEERQCPIFLDLKLHDIPNTVAKAVKATVRICPFLMTVHASGGKTMMKAAMEAAKEIEIKWLSRPMIVGVTVLTSFDQNDLNGIGVGAQVSDQVVRLAELAREAGLDGVVCSSHEIEAIRKACGADFKLVVPGIRPAGSDVGDQKRVLTPKEAVSKGADYLVIGRPITEAADPKAAAQAIWKSIQ